MMINRQSSTYRIRVQGHLDPSWLDWFAGMSMRHETNGETVIYGPVADQAALNAMLNRLYGLGVTLVSVTPGEDTEQTDPTS